MNGGGGGPRTFWERERGSALGPVPPVDGAPERATAPGTPRGHQPSPASQPSGPPARVGGAVAALVVAVLTLAAPILGFYMGLWFFVLVMNLPGIALGVIALLKVPNAAEVERYIRYTWACTFAYATLSVLFLVPAMVFMVMTALFVV